APGCRRKSEPRRGRRLDQGAQRRGKTAPDGASGPRERSERRYRRVSGRSTVACCFSLSTTLEVAMSDVLIPVDGIVDVSDSHALVRTSGYLAGPNDVYVSMAQIKRYGLRRGDAVTGAASPERKGKHIPLVRLDTINGM